MIFIKSTSFCHQDRIRYLMRLLNFVKNVCCTCYSTFLLKTERSFFRNKIPFFRYSLFDALKSFKHFKNRIGRKNALFIFMTGNCIANMLLSTLLYVNGIDPYVKEILFGILRLLTGNLCWILCNLTFQRGIWFHVKYVNLNVF